VKFSRPERQNRRRWRVGQRVLYVWPRPIGFLHPAHEIHVRRIEQRPWPGPAIQVTRIPYRRRLRIGWRR
jgi:hypothetical protein